MQVVWLNADKRFTVKTISEIRADFPILATKVYGKPLIYFDNGATSQKPEAVINKLNEVYRNYNGNIHRGVHASVSYTHLTLPTIYSV